MRLRMDAASADVFRIGGPATVVMRPQGQVPASEAATMNIVAANIDVECIASFDLPIWCSTSSHLTWSAFLRSRYRDSVLAGHDLSWRSRFLLPDLASSVC